MRRSAVGSSDAVGSSRRSTEGSLASVRARETRCASPPERLFAGRSQREPGSPTRRRSARARAAARSPVGSPFARSLGPYRTFSLTVPSKSAGC